MIYFKIADMETEAGERHQQYMHERREAAKLANELRREIGVESEDAVILPTTGDLAAFQYEDDHRRPTGLLVEDGVLVPNENSNWGQAIKEKMDSISFPTQADYMAMIFGVAGELLEHGRLYTGVGLVTNEDLALLSCKMKVWENARQREGFEIPKGCEEITASEYEHLRSKMLANGNRETENESN